MDFMELDKHTYIKLELTVIDKENFFKLVEPYKATIEKLELRELANAIVELVDGYACELDTTTDNLEVKLEKITVWKNL